MVDFDGGEAVSKAIPAHGRSTCHRLVNSVVDIVD